MLLSVRQLRQWSTRSKHRTKVSTTTFLLLTPISAADPFRARKARPTSIEELKSQAPSYIVRCFLSSQSQPRRHHTVASSSVNKAECNINSKPSDYNRTVVVDDHVSVSPRPPIRLLYQKLPPIDGRRQDTNRTGSC